MRDGLDSSDGDSCSDSDSDCQHDSSDDEDNDGKYCIYNLCTTPNFILSICVILLLQSSSKCATTNTKM